MHNQLYSGCEIIDIKPLIKKKHTDERCRRSQNEERMGTQR
jgi:hypothetical protein